MSKRDYYEILEISKDASKDEIKKAYRKMAIKYHPDKNAGDKEAEEKFKECAEAYDTLSNDEKKRKYDMFGHQEIGGRSNMSASDIFNMFGDIFGGRQPQNQRILKGQDIRITEKFSLEDLYFGTTRKVKYKRNSVCKKCNGTGGEDKQKCDKCNGLGQIIETQQIGSMIMQQVRPCHVCNGTGEIVVKPCKKCDGKGIELSDEEFEVQVPAGAFNGGILIIQGKGHAIKGGIDGDLQILISEKPHDYYERKGSDLKYYLDLSYPEIVLGCEKEIPTIEGGKVKIKIKELSQPNTILRLKDKGMVSHETGERGDLHIQLGVEIPELISDRERELLEELKKIKK